ncbi:MAG: AmpG family muropeptide MFS transporter [Myxococcota bacterium]
MLERWLTNLKAVYFTRHMVLLTMLGFSSGLPLLLVYSTLSFWLLDVGLAIGAVGIFSAVRTPYSFKFTWAPLLDHVPLPVLTRWLGRRRAWMLVLQVLLLGALVCTGSTDPGANPWWTGLGALLIAALSASQDVVVDAYRVEILEEDEQGAGAAAAVFGYRIGMLVAGAGALAMAEYWGDWGLVYMVMAGFMSVGVLATAVAPEPERPVPQDDPLHPDAPGSRTGKERAWAWVVRAVWGPLREMFSREGWWLWVLFIMAYKLGDALAGTMLNPFLVDLGFTKLEIAGVAKTYGLATSIFGVFFGGWLVKHTGVLRALWIAGFMQMGSNLIFILQAWAGHDLFWLALTIGVENLCGGVGTAAFVAYLSGLCKREYTATQYALLTAISSTLRLALSTSTGFLAGAMGWASYFGLTTLSALPGLALLWWMRQRQTSSDPDDEGAQDALP